MLTTQPGELTTRGTIKDFTGPYEGVHHLRQEQEITLSSYGIDSRTLVGSKG